MTMGCALGLDEHEPRKEYESSNECVEGYLCEKGYCEHTQPRRDGVVGTKPHRHGLSDDNDDRKSAPINDAVLGYFPNTLTELARYAKFGNDKHNPGEELHWAFNKSTDHGNCLIRHQLQAEEIDPSSGFYHAVAVAIRALMQCETILLKNHPELRPGHRVKGFVR